MGVTYVELEVANPAQPSVKEKLTFLVDSGAVYSVAPREVLDRLGIKPLVSETFLLDNGEKIVREKGVELYQYGERLGGADVIFGEPGDANLLGALTLEALGLSLDPLKRELKPLPMLLA